MPNHSVAALPPCQAKTTSCHSTVAAAVTVTASNSGRTTSITHTDSVTSAVWTLTYTYFTGILSRFRISLFLSF